MWQIGGEKETCGANADSFEFPLFQKAEIR